MSMDLEVWSSKTLTLPGDLPEPGRWAQYGNDFVWEADEWQVSVVQEARPPSKEVAARLSDNARGVCVTLEPIGAPEEAYRQLETTVRHLARISEGLWLSAQGTLHRHDEGDW
jgi:hypothetical protein